MRLNKLKKLFLIDKLQMGGTAFDKQKTSLMGTKKCAPISKDKNQNYRTSLGTEQFLLPYFFFRIS